jgi:hypothetical protein
LKVKKTKKWSNQDTTDLTVEVDADSFLTWAKQLDAWYDKTYQFAVSNRIPFVIVGYELDVDIAEDIAIQKLIEKLSIVGINSKPKWLSRKRRYYMQDKSSDTFRSISNGEALRSSFIQQDILDYALRRPLDGQPASFSEVSRLNDHIYSRCGFGRVDPQ